MELESQRGSSLVETAIAIAIVSILAGAALSAVIAAMHGTRNPISEALGSSARREMTVAEDVLKYQGSEIVPAAIATTLPLPGGSQLPAELSVETLRLPLDAVAITITAAASGRSERVTLTATLSQRAPIPGTLLHASGLVAAPTGAP